MEKCTCFKCKKLFFYDPAIVPYRATDDNVCNLTLNTFAISNTLSLFSIPSLINAKSMALSKSCNV